MHALSTYENLALLALQELLSNQSQWTHRAVETVAVRDNALRRRCSLDITLPPISEEKPAAEKQEEAQETEAPAPIRYLIPILTPKRGELIDNLDVEDAAGNSLPVLCHTEHEHIAGLVLDGAADILLKDLGTGEQEQKNRFQEALRTIPLAEEDTAALFVQQLFGTARRSDLTASQQVLWDLCWVLAESYLLLTEIEATPGSRVLIKFSYDSPYFDEVGNKSRSEKWRQRLGHSPYSFLIETPLATATESYHFRMTAPEKHFLRKQFFSTPQAVTGTGDTDGLSKVSEYEPRPGEMVVGQDAQGTPYSHLYATGLGESRNNPPLLYARAIFYEIPMGTMGNVLFYSLVALISLVVVGAALPLFLASASGLTSIPALLLALPGFGALWLRPSVSSASLLRAPLASRVGIVVVGVVSYTAALLLVIGGALAGDSPLSSSETVLFYGAWLLLVVAVGGVFAKLWFRLGDNRRMYDEAVRPPE
jgi:hypothetical protein